MCFCMWTRRLKDTAGHRCPTGLCFGGWIAAEQPGGLNKEWAGGTWGDSQNCVQVVTPKIQLRFPSPLRQLRQTDSTYRQWPAGEQIIRWEMQQWLWCLTSLQASWWEQLGSEIFKWFSGCVCHSAAAPSHTFYTFNPLLPQFQF